LENILTLDPANEFAQEELPQVKARQARLFAPTYAPEQEKPPPAIISLPEAAKTPLPDLYPYKDEFDDPWLCPFCAAPTRPEDQACPACRRSFIIRRRVKEERTAWLWRAIFLQFGVTLALATLGVSLFIILPRFQGIRDPFAFLPLYFGQIGTQPENLGQVILTAFPRWLFWGFSGATLYSFLLMVLLYIRILHGNTLYLVNASVVLLLSFLTIIFYYASMPLLIAGVVGLFLGAAQLFITLNLWNDFTFNERRIQLRIDRDAKTHMTLYQSGRRYSKLAMWGLAVIHLRRAAVGNPKSPAYQIALAIAYMNIKRYDLATKTLDQAEKLDPHALEIWQIRKQLETQAEHRLA
jgi:tetratricopeptide (TPR) repeat protein